MPAAFMERSILLLRTSSSLKGLCASPGARFCESKHDAADVRTRAVGVFVTHPQSMEQTSLICFQEACFLQLAKFGKLVLSSIEHALEIDMIYVGRQVISKNTTPPGDNIQLWTLY